MLRRDFGKLALGAMASTAFIKPVLAARGSGAVSANDFPKTPGLTDYVGRFVATTKYEDIPPEVIELGKKSILDGLGLALAGSRAETGTIGRQYLKNMGVCGGQATIAGSALKTSPRFAAFVNGVSIHADDFDDTQLSAAKDRVYGLLVHPTVPVLPAILALSAQRNISGKEFMLAYHLGVEVECKIAESRFRRDTQPRAELYPLTLSHWVGRLRNKFWKQIAASSMPSVDLMIRLRSWIAWESRGHSPPRGFR